MTIGYSQVFNPITEKNKIGLMTKFVDKLFTDSNQSELILNESQQAGLLKNQTRLKPSYPVNMLFKKGNFPIIGLEKHTILICTGTGLAPIRFFLFERYENFKSQKIKSGIGKSLLFFGSRNKDKDFIYAKELEMLRTQELFK